MIFRAYFATPKLHRDGVPINAVKTFARSILRLQQHFSDATHFGVMLDTASRSNFRVQLYPGYKGHRQPTPDELRVQLPIIEEFLRVCGVPTVKQPGMEADDLLASYAVASQREGGSVTLVTTDKDLYQMVSDQCCVYNPFKRAKGGGSGLTIHREYVNSEFGVQPERMAEVARAVYQVQALIGGQVQALAGDSADNVPGVKGIGIKTASRLIAQHGSLETVLAAAHDEASNMPHKLRSKLKVASPAAGGGS